MKIKEQNVYTDLFFNKPSRVLDVMNEVTKFDDENSSIELYGDGTVLLYYVPLEENREVLAQLFNVDRYLELAKEEYDQSDTINDITCLDLTKAIYDLTNTFGVSVKVERDMDYEIYCDDDDTEVLFNVTWDTVKAEHEAQRTKESEASNG